MLRQLGATVAEAVEPFTPEGGRLWPWPHDGPRPWTRACHDHDHPHDHPPSASPPRPDRFGRMTETGLLTLVQWLSPAFPVGGYRLFARAGMGDRGGRGRVGGRLRGTGSRRSWPKGRGGRMRSCWPRRWTGVGPGRPWRAGRGACGQPASGWIETLEQGRGAGADGQRADGAGHSPAALSGGARRWRREDWGCRRNRCWRFTCTPSPQRWCSAAVRFVPLGQTEGQRMLAELQPLIRRMAAEAVRQRGIDDIGPGAFRRRSGGDAA